MRLSLGPRAAILAAAVCGLSSCSKEAVDLETVSAFERQFRMPPEAGPLGQYARFYAPARRLSAGDLPFTTLKDHIPGLELGRSRTLATAVYLRVAETEAAQTPGVKLVNEADLPRHSDDGCAVVNVVYDPATLQSIDAWCNSDFYKRWASVNLAVPAVP